VLFVRLEMIGDVDPPDHQDLAVLTDLAPHVGFELAATSIDSTRLQRAPEGPDQSAPGCGHHVVEGGGVGRQ
jgi:hypothetical protein